MSIIGAILIGGGLGLGAGIVVAAIRRARARDDDMPADPFED